MRAAAAPWQVVARRAFASRSTLQRIEEGHPNVGIGIYAAVLNARLRDPTLISKGTFGASVWHASTKSEARKPSR